MKIFIDADGCPVVHETINISKQYNIECLIICDTAHVFNTEYAQVIMVDKGADSVDFKLVNMIRPGDIVITQDYGLAAMCLSKNTYVLNQNGLEYANDNISSLLEFRAIAKKARNSGGRLKGPHKRTTENDKAFKNKLISIIEKVIKQ